MRSYDIVVIGAGPAGCAAAITAARAGARVCVLDRTRFPRPKTCGDAVSNRAAMLVDQLGGQPDLLRTVPHAVVRGASAVLPDGTRIDREFGEHPGYIVPRLHLDELLRKQLEPCGVEVTEGVRVRSLVMDGERIVGARSQDRTWLAETTIAADGPGSVGWAALGAPYKRGVHLGVAVTGYYRDVDFGDAEGLTEHYFEHGLRCGYGWVFPAVEGLANVGIYQRQDRYEAGSDTLAASLQAFVQRHPERFRGATRQGRTRTWALPLAARLAPPGGPGLLLAGDAANSIDPLSGEGIWQALFTGCEAGALAARCMGKGGVDWRTVRRYQLRWATQLGVTSLTRLAVQEAMGTLVESGAYRWSFIQRALIRGYQSEHLEVSKRLH